jgi:hypothetical protein
MNNAHERWIDTFSRFVQFYPKLTTAIAFTTMAAAGRMVAARRIDVPRNDAPVVHQPKAAGKRSKALKGKAKRKTARH